jgi:hypothetical protein
MVTLALGVINGPTVRTAHGRLLVLVSR